MQTSSLEILEKNQLLPAQARAILQVMESELAARDSLLATRADLLATKADLQTEIRDLEFRLSERIHGVEIKLEAFRAELKSEIQGVVRWNFAFWVVQLGAIAGLLKLLK